MFLVYIPIFVEIIYCKVFIPVNSVDLSDNALCNGYCLLYKMIKYLICFRLCEIQKQEIRKALHL